MQSVRAYSVKRGMEWVGGVWTAWMNDVPVPTL